MASMVRTCDQHVIQSMLQNNSGIFRSKFTPAAGLLVGKKAAGGVNLFDVCYKALVLRKAALWKSLLNASTYGNTKEVSMRVNK